MNRKGQQKQIDGYSTGQFSGGEKQGKVLNCSSKDEDSIFNTVFCSQEMGKK